MEQAFYHGGKGEPGTHSARAPKFPEILGISILDSSVKYHVYCPCTKRKLSVILLFIYTQWLFATLTSAIAITLDASYFCLGKAQEPVGSRNFEGKEHGPSCH